MRHTPLQLANPHGDPRQLRRVFVQLNAQHVVKPGDQIGLTVQPQRSCVQVAAMLNVFQRLQPQKQKVATATSGVQHAVVLELLQPHHKLRTRQLGVSVTFASTFGH